MKHIKAVALALRIIGGLVLVWSVFLAFQGFAMLRYTDSIVSPNVILCASVFLPCVITLLLGVGCFIIAAIMKRKK